MKPHMEREAADLETYPNLVVIYLGMRVYSLRGLATVLAMRREVRSAVNANPVGLLCHESFYFSLLPLHVGLRQYWRDFEALETWTRSFPHENWLKTFLQNPKGTGFWHETYSLRGGMEGIYDAVREPFGLRQFAPAKRALGGMSTARGRLKQSADR